VNVNEHCRALPQLRAVSAVVQRPTSAGISCTQHSTRTTDREAHVLMGKGRYQMRWTRILISAAVLFFAGTRRTYSQDSAFLGRSLSEFRRACIDSGANSYFERSGVSSYACALPNGDRIAASVANRGGDELRVVGLVREVQSTPGPGVRTTRSWPGRAHRALGAPDRTTRGPDGCLFAEWRDERTITLLLHCRDRVTVASMLRTPRRQPDRGRKPKGTITKIE
jgi:hypothetical protein